MSSTPVEITWLLAAVSKGDAAAFETVKPVLLAIGPKVIHIGGNGLACQMKIAVNLLLMVEVIAFGEAVALAEKGGVEREIALDAILKSVAASPATPASSGFAPCWRNATATGTRLLGCTSG